MTINTDADVIRVIQENPRILVDALTAHPELIAEVRRVVLTDELLAMPEQLAQVIKTQNEMLKSLTETREIQNEMLKSLTETRETQNEMLKSLTETREIQNEMLKSLTETRETQNEMLKAQREMLEEQTNVRKDIGALHGMYRQQHEDFGRFRGAYAIDTAKRNVGDIALIIAKSRAHRLHRIAMADFTLSERNEFLDRNYDDVDALNLRERAWATFLTGDVITRVTERRGNGRGFYIAMEASYTADIEDAQRAIDHAKILRCEGDLDAYAVVAGVRRNLSVEGILYEDVERFIGARDEDSVLWFQLDPKDLRPDDPF